MTMDSSFDLRKWLDELGLGQYASSMEAQDIGREILPKLTDDDLKECGVSSVGHRRAIMVAISEMQAQSPMQIVPEASPPVDRDGEISELLSVPGNGIGDLAVAEPEAPTSPKNGSSEILAAEPIIARCAESDSSLPPGADSQGDHFAAVAQEPATQESSIPEMAERTAGMTKTKLPRVKVSLLARIRRAYVKASGGSLLLSIGIHAIIILIGTYLVVSQVVEDRKISFGGGDRGQKNEVQHKVKMKQRPTTAPAQNKRITTSSSAAKVSLPDRPNAQSNMGPSIAGAMGSGGFSSPAGSLGSSGGGLQGATSFSAFGFRGLKSGAGAGLVGHLYDLKQTKDGLPTNIKDDGGLRNPHLLDSIPGEYARRDAWGAIWADKSNFGKRKDLLTESFQNHTAVINEFINTWDPAILARYYQSKIALVAPQFFIPSCSSLDALKAFGVEKEVKPTHFVIHYKGTIRSPKDGYFRFRGFSTQAGLFIRFNNENAFGVSTNPLCDRKRYTFKNTDNPTDTRHTLAGYRAGKWFHVLANQKYPIEILMENNDGGFCECIMIEERTPAEPYLKRFASELYPQDPVSYCYPVFAMKKGIPLPPFDKEGSKRQIAARTARPPSDGTPEQRAGWRPYEPMPEAVPAQLIFTAE